LVWGGPGRFDGHGYLFRLASEAQRIRPSQGRRAGRHATAAETKIWQRATSLGGIEHRASIEGPDTPLPALSVGIEHADNLLADVTQALDRTG
jgi:cystathionine gamma-synthase